MGCGALRRGSVARVRCVTLPGARCGVCGVRVPCRLFLVLDALKRDRRRKEMLKPRHIGRT